MPIPRLVPGIVLACDAEIELQGPKVFVQCMRPISESVFTTALEEGELLLNINSRDGQRTESGDFEVSSRG